MRAMVLTRQGAPLDLIELPDPQPGPWQLRLRVKACGLCRTDLQVRAETTSYPLERTNQTLDDLRRGASQGSAVVTI
jgi:D-arabinose 1-dehydrogenase-like Zn-dependent alcohol dehydrogenase